LRKFLAQIPNILTVIRILLIPVIIYFLQRDEHQLALLIFVIAAVTDALDGFIAKSFQITSKFGTYLDPIADKLLLDSTYAILAIMGWLPIWLAALVWLRDMVILLGAGTLHFRGHQLRIKPALVGKATTLAQIITVGLFFDVGVSHALHFWRPIAVIVTAILTLWSGAYYCVMGLRMNKAAGA
jgi:cardiolipin synthase